MLRAIAISVRVGPRAGTRHPCASAQWQHMRRFADFKTTDNQILPGTQSKTALSGGVAAPPVLESASKTPAAPSSGSTIPPQNVPLTPPAPPTHVQASPTISIPPVSSGGSTPSPPPQPPKKTHRFRNFFLFLIVLSGLSYSGGVYYSLVNDNFHDFFTEYVPFGEEAVLYFEEREFKRRFPDEKASRGVYPQTRGEPKLTIASKSGVSAKVAEEKKDGESSRGGAVPSISKPSSSEQTKARPTEVVKKEEPKPHVAKPAEAKTVDVKEMPKSTPKEIPASAPKKESTVAPPPAPTSISRLDPLNVDNATDPMVQGVTKILNDIIAVVNADNAAEKYSTTMLKAKDDLKKLASDITDLKAAENQSADETIKMKEAEFDKGAKELLKRIESEMREQELRWREEYEAEQVKISANYEKRLKAELEVADKLADQKLRNQLLEQDLKLREEFTTSVKDRIETERSGRLGKLNELSSSVEELQSLTSSWNEVVESNLKTQHLVVAVEAVRSILESSDRPTPFIHELAALKEVAIDDPVVNAAIASINPKAYQSGIPTAAQLVDRFRRVAGEVRKAALLPEDAGVASHVASFVLSRVMFQKKGLAVGDDVESVLTRTETYLEEGNLDEAAREMNGLTGWAKVLCKDWLSDCRAVLEVRQALDVIATEARLQSLMLE